jgi:hypothetical protein
MERNHPVDRQAALFATLAVAFCRVSLRDDLRDACRALPPLRLRRPGCCQRSCGCPEVRELCFIELGRCWIRIKGSGNDRLGCTMEGHGEACLTATRCHPFTSTAAGAIEPTRLYEGKEKIGEGALCTLTIFFIIRDNASQESEVSPGMGMLKKDDRPI